MQQGFNRKEIIEKITPIIENAAMKNGVIPIEIDGTQGEMVMQAAVRSLDNVIYWDIDGEYLGSTESKHEISVAPKPGKHVLTITDSNGNSKKRR